VPPTVRRYPITFLSHEGPTDSFEVTFDKPLRVEVKDSHTTRAGEACINYSFHQSQNAKLLQEMIRDKTLLDTFPFNEIRSGHGTKEALYADLKIWKDHKGDYTLSFLGNLTPGKPYFELPLSNFDLAATKMPKNNWAIQSSVVQDSSPLKRTLPHHAFRGIPSTPIQFLPIDVC
jgi:hypothetical protein